MALPLITDRRDLQLDASGDLVVTTDLQFTTGIAAIVQSCRIALQLFKGEWFLDLDAGIPYWQSILGARRNAAIAAAQIAFRSELEAVSGVLAVTLLTVAYDPPTRGLIVKWQVSTVFGDTPVDTLPLSGAA